ncbi:MAG: GNAT family N-acetyltransferase [Eubacteriales bacterium]|nr:GNAT family N-acetyltransferase [Eubacteriales bacterium]
MKKDGKNNATECEKMIRPMKNEDRQSVIDMMRIFYHSEAVLSDGSEEIYRNDVETCLSDSPFLEGFIFEEEGKTAGYAMIAKSFSTEFGKPCIWIEDLYLKEEYRGKGLGTAFFRYLEERFPQVIFRLEAEEENERAIAVYHKNGYQVLPYLELIREEK